MDATCCIALRMASTSSREPQKHRKKNFRNEHDLRSWMITAWRVWGFLSFFVPIFSSGGVLDWLSKVFF